MVQLIALDLYRVTPVTENMYVLYSLYMALFARPAFSEHQCSNATSTPLCETTCCYIDCCHSGCCDGGCCEENEESGQEIFKIVLGVAAPIMVLVYLWITYKKHQRGRHTIFSRFLHRQNRSDPNDQTMHTQPGGVFSQPSSAPTPLSGDNLDTGQRDLQYNSNQYGQPLTGYGMTSQAPAFQQSTTPSGSAPLPPPPSYNTVTNS